MRSTVYFYESVPVGHVQQLITPKRTYFMAVIDGVFCLDIYKRETLSVVTLQWSDIMGTYSTLDTYSMRDRGLSIGHEI